MSRRAIAWARSQIYLSPGTRRVLLVLATAAEGDVPEASPSIDDISAAASCSSANACLALRRLVKAGLIAQVHKGGGRGVRSIYRLNLGATSQPRRWTRQPADRPAIGAVAG